MKLLQKQELVKPMITGKEESMGNGKAWQSPAGGFRRYAGRQ